MILKDGPLEGYELADPKGFCASIVVPQLDGPDGCIEPHFIQHHYTHDGHWLHSETFVGYESDESIERREAFWAGEYWGALEQDSNESFV